MGGKGHLDLVAFFVQFFLGVLPPLHREAALDHGLFEYVGRKMPKWTLVRLNTLGAKCANGPRSV